MRSNVVEVQARLAGSVGAFDEFGATDRIEAIEAAIATVLDRWSNEADMLAHICAHRIVIQTAAIRHAGAP